MQKVLVVLGPTATGKTDLALSLAKKFDGELVSCDSRQVYKGLDIGTGKEPGKSITNYELRVKKEKGYWEIDGVKVWMYDVADPKKQYTVKDYVEQAGRIVEDIMSRGKLPIIVGGTGLYLKALLEGLPSLDIPTNEKLRGELEKLSLEELQQKLRTLSPTSWGKMNNSDRQNSRRLLRSIEITSMNGYSVASKKLEVKSQKYETLKIGLTAPRDVLKNRIYSRLLARIDQGMIREAEQLHQGGLSFKRMEELGLEYGMLAKLLAGQVNEDQLVDLLSVKISQYAKRQMTWFKNPSTSSGCINWFDITAKGWLDVLERQVASWYYSNDDDKKD